MEKSQMDRQYVPRLDNGKITDGLGILIDDAKNTQNNSTLGAYRGRTLITNNVSYKNGAGGIVAFSSENVDIINNTAYLNNQSPEITGGQVVAVAANNVRVWNNILYAYPGKRVNNYWGNNNVVYDYNIYANSNLISAQGPNDILADPQFVNPESGDFRLKSTSPAINKAREWGGLDTDFANNARPSNNISDIGAYEYQF